MDISNYNIDTIHKITPCKGNLETYDKSTWYTQSVYVNQQLYSTSKNFFSEIITNINLTRPINILEDTVTCIIPNIKTYIELVAPREEIKTTPNTYLCNIDGNNYQKMPHRFKTHIEKTIYDLDFVYKVKTYLESIRAVDFLYFENDNLIIFPNMISNPIDKTDVDMYHQILTDDEECYNYLSKIGFYILSKKLNSKELHPYGLYTADNIITLFNTNHKDEIIKLVTTAKESMTKFIQDKFKRNYDFNILNLYVCVEYTYGNFIIKVDILNNIESAKYISFIDGNRWIKYDDYLNLIKYGNLKYVSKFYDAIDGDLSHICKGNHSYDLDQLVKSQHKYKFIQANQKGGNIINLKDIFESEFKFGYKVVNYFHRPTITKEKAQCIQSMLLLTFDNAGKTNRTYYEIIFRSNLFDYLKHNKSEIHTQIEHTINSKPLFSFNNNRSVVFISNINWHGTFTIRKLGAYKIPIKIPIIETKEITQLIEKNILENNPVIDNSIIITYIIAYLHYEINTIGNQEYATNYNKIIAHMNSNSFLKQLLDNTYFSTERNFFITTKKIANVNQIDTLDKTYCLWYYPKEIKITHINLFMNSILIFNESDTHDQIRKNNFCRHLLHQSTNFYDLFSDKNKFVYNATYLTTLHKNEINALINKFLYFTYCLEKKLIYSKMQFTKFDITKVNFGKNSNIFWEYKSNPYFSWIHYPNQYDYNVFHLHLARMKNFKKINDTVLYDKHQRYKLTFNRDIDWEYINNVEFGKIDHMLVRKINLGNDLLETINNLIFSIDNLKRTISLRNINITTIDLLKNIINKYELYDNNLSSVELLNIMQKY